MQLAHSGDEKARHAVALRSVVRAKTVARGLLSSEEACDVSQIVAMNVLDSAGRFRGDCTLETWIDRIAVRVAWKTARRVRPLQRAASLETIGELMSNPPPSTSSEALPRPIESYLSELPEKQRLALVLRYGLDLSVDEVADAADIPTNTAKTRLRTGLAALRQLIRRDLRLGLSHRNDEDD